ncbi:hypothetical protein [Methylomonas albis]|nr:hypothetical protein [Methylomonas albis]
MFFNVNFVLAFYLPSFFYGFVVFLTKTQPKKPFKGCTEILF